MLVLSGILGVLQFTLYLLGAAFRAIRERPRRTCAPSWAQYSAAITYGLGACLGPLIAGALMSWAGPRMYFAFISG